MTDQRTGESRSETAVYAAFIKHQIFLKKFLARFLSRPQDIEDVAQEAFLKAYRAEKKQAVRSPKSFLFQIAKNIALQELTKKSHLITDYIEDLANPEVPYQTHRTGTLEDTVEAQDKLAVFCEAVASLPPQCRRTFLMRKVHGLSHREIAKSLGIAVSTVEKHQAIGLKRCSEYMRKKGWGDDSALSMLSNTELNMMGVMEQTDSTQRGHRDARGG
jgi:RNA polymerase sigma factor (sigma-70 family)